jgi:hypothetical protein
MLIVEAVVSIVGFSKEAAIVKYEDNCEIACLTSDE